MAAHVAFPSFDEEAALLGQPLPPLLLPWNGDNRFQRTCMLPGPLQQDVFRPSVPAIYMDVPVDFCTFVLSRNLFTPVVYPRDFAPVAHADDDYDAVVPVAARAHLHHMSDVLQTARCACETSTGRTGCFGVASFVCAYSEALDFGGVAIDRDLQLACFLCDPGPNVFVLELYHAPS